MLLIYFLFERISYSEENRPREIFHLKFSPHTLASGRAGPGHSHGPDSMHLPHGWQGVTCPSQEAEPEAEHPGLGKGTVICHAEMLTGSLTRYTTMSWPALLYFKSQILKTS